MMEESIKKLDDSTSWSIRKEQIITRVSDVVRELVENAFDADARQIKVYLENYGMKKIEVRDDGCGIPTSSLKKVVQGGFTAKAPKNENLSCDDFYGFRGEALSGICAVGSLSITSKTKEEPQAICLQYDSSGKIKSELKAYAHNKGTVVVVSDLFAKMPVRCKYYTAKNKLVAELKEVENFLKTVSIVNYKCHITLAHNGNCIYTKAATINMDQAFSSVFSFAIFKQLRKCKSIEVVDCEDSEQDKDKIFNKLELFVPKLPIDTKTMLCTSDKMTMIFVNRKAVKIREFEKILKEYICSKVDNSKESSSASAKFPVCVLNIEVPSRNVDFNREVDKSKLFLVHKEEIAEKLKITLDEFYATTSKENNNQLISVIEILDMDDRSPAPGPSSIQPNVNVLEEKRSENIMSFLDNIPVVDPSNFNKSPIKTSNGFVNSSKSPMKTNTPTLLENSNKAPEHRISEPMPVDKNLMNVSDINDKDWVHGRMTDKLGNIIESTVVVSADPQRTRLNDSCLVPTTPTLQTCRDFSLYRASSRLDERITAKRLYNESDLSQYESPDKRARHSSRAANSDMSRQNTTLSDIRRKSSEPRQITLETLKNWPKIGAPFAKNNTVISTPNPQYKSFSKFSRLNGEEETLSSSTRSKRTGVTSNQSPSIIEFINQRQKYRNEASGTLGLRTSVNAPSLGRKISIRQVPDVDDSQNTQSSNAAPEVIGRLTNLPNSMPSLYVVKVHNILGVLSPQNLLQMEPSIRDKSKIGDSVNIDLLGVKGVQDLVHEFSELDCEDYSEEQVKSVFSCLRNFNQETMDFCESYERQEAV